MPAAICCGDPGGVATEGAAADTCFCGAARAAARAAAWAAAALTAAAARARAAFRASWRATAWRRGATRAVASADVGAGPCGRAGGRPGGGPAEGGAGHARRRGGGISRPGRHRAGGDARQGQGRAGGDDRDLGGPAVQGFAVQVLAREGFAVGSPSASRQRQPLIGRGRAVRLHPGTDRPPGGRRVSGVGWGAGAGRPAAQKAAVITYAGCLRPPTMPETAVAGARNGRLVPYEKDHTKKTVCAIK